MDATSAEAARKDFRHLLDVAHYQGRPTVITKFGQDWAAIAPLGVLHTADAAARLSEQLASAQQRSAGLLATCTHHTEALRCSLELIERLRIHLPPGTDPVAEEHYAALQALVADPPAEDQPTVDAETTRPSALQSGETTP